MSLPALVKVDNGRLDQMGFDHMVVVAMQGYSSSHEFPRKYFPPARVDASYVMSCSVSFLKEIYKREDKT